MAGLGDLVGKGFSARSLLGVGYKIVVVVAAIFAIGLVVWIILSVLRYNKKVILVEKVGNGMRFKTDKGYKDKAKMEFKVLFNRNIDFAYPRSQDEFPYNRGSIIPFVVINQQAAPIQGISDNPKFIPADLNMMAHLIARLKKNDELTKNKPTWWDKHGQSVLLITMMTVLFVSIIFILKRVDKAIDMGSNAIGIANSQSKQVIQSMIPTLAFASRRFRKWIRN